MRWGFTLIPFRRRDQIPALSTRHCAGPSVLAEEPSQAGLRIPLVHLCRGQWYHAGYQSLMNKGDAEVQVDIGNVGAI